MIVIGNGLAWLILGMTWRFSNAGKVVSGDLLEPTAAQKLDSDLWGKAREEAAHEKGYLLQSAFLMKVFYFYLLPVTAALVFIGGTSQALLKPEPR